MENFEYSLLMGILPLLAINSITGWLFLSSFLLIITGLITSVGEVVSIRRNNLLFSVSLAAFVMLIYLIFFGVIGFIILPFIWLATHILIVQVKNG